MSTGTFSATPSTAATLSDASPPPPFPHPIPPPAPTPASASLHPRTPLISSHLREKKKNENTYIYLFEETEDLGIASKVSTSIMATTEMQTAKETPPPTPPLLNGFLFEASRMNKEGKRGRTERRGEGICEEERER